MNDYFYGWYFRCQSGEETLAVIPAVHRSKGKWSCSVQVITEAGSWNKNFSIRQFRINREKGVMQIGENIFSQKGLRLKLEENRRIEDGYSWKIQGLLRFGSFTPPVYDIMGPFRWIPGMECRHDVYSMEHSVNGQISVNGRKVFFQNGWGYMEGDSGSSFPQKYMWTQHFFDGGSIMLAAATIPLFGMCFKGVTGILLRRGREYRFATYLGASVRKMEKRELRIRQGRYVMRVYFPKSRGNTLNAPCSGRMSRRIREDISCQAEYVLSFGNRTLWREKAERAAAEQEADGKASG